MEKQSQEDREAPAADPPVVPPSVPERHRKGPDAGTGQPVPADVVIFTIDLSIKKTDDESIIFICHRYSHGGDHCF
jgi:hypothetical protein